MTSAKVGVLLETTGRDHSRAKALAEALDLPLLQRGDTCDLIVVVTDERIELRDGAVPDRGGVAVDFGAIELRVATGNTSRKQPLGRAVGDRARTVFDATAGFGHDAALLCAMGLEVTAVERHPVVHALLADGYARALADESLAPIFNRLRVVPGDAAEVLTDIEQVPDAVYLDPMYPPSRKTALPPKPAQLLRRLVGADEDAARVLACARARGVHRVVVKRPHHAPTLDAGVAHVIESKLVRYDVYIDA